VDERLLDVLGFGIRMRWRRIIGHGVDERAYSSLAGS
jgi:hypothetical protein